MEPRRRTIRVNGRPANTNFLGRVFGRLATLALGVGIALAGVELATRIVMPHWLEYASERFMTTATADGQMVSIARPGFDGMFAQNNGDFRIHLQIDANGLRNDPGANPAGALWAIGDSFTFGWGVERDQTYARAAAQALALPDYLVASPGTDICGYQALVKRILTDAKPRAAIIGLTLENDITDYEASCAPAAVQAADQAPPENIATRLKHRVIGIKQWLTPNSAFYNLMAVAAKRSPALQSVLTRVGIIAPTLSQQWHTARHNDATLDSTVRQLANLRALLPPDIPVVVLLIPTRFDLEEPDSPWAEDRLALAARLRANNLMVVDAEPSLRTAGLAHAHFPHDGHWSPLGHRLAGEAAAVVLQPLLNKEPPR